MPRGVASRWTTIDVHGTPNISSGEFRLGFWGDGVQMPCIPANSSALSADAIADALTDENNALSVTVSEMDPPFDGARRFLVYFNEPQLGVPELGIAGDMNDECESIKCGEDSTDVSGGCDAFGVLIDRDMSQAVQDGAVEVSCAPPVQPRSCLPVGW